MIFLGIFNLSPLFFGEVISLSIHYPSCPGEDKGTLFAGFIPGIIKQGACLGRKTCQTGVQP